MAKTAVGELREREQLREPERPASSVNLSTSDERWRQVAAVFLECVNVSVWTSCTFGQDRGGVTIPILVWPCSRR